MNTNKMINCLYEGLKAIQVEFARDGQPYTYKTFDDYEIGDKCVVDSPRDGLVIVEVTGVDSSLLEENYRFKWVVQKINTENYDGLVAREEEAADKISKLIREKRRRDSMNEITELLGSEANLFLISNELNGSIEPEPSTDDVILKCDDCQSTTLVFHSETFNRNLCKSCHGARSNDQE